MSKNKSTNKDEKFSEIKTYENLIEYLRHPDRRIKNDSVVCHYTSLSAAISIISDKFWYMGNPQNMNDGLEPERYHMVNAQGSNNDSNKFFFSSFMIEQKESIAMWSMYAQPWQDGVMISIPAGDFKKWVKEKSAVYKADRETKKATNCIVNDVAIESAQIAYVSNENEKVIIHCGKVSNEKFQSVKSPILSGYIKDDAWSYEKELRIRADVKNGTGIEAVSIQVPEYIIDSMVITKGPRFTGDLTQRIKNAVNRKMKTDKSLFFEKLNYTPCDNCSYKDKSK